jgi:hypothetical protein
MSGSFPVSPFRAVGTPPIGWLGRWGAFSARPPCARLRPEWASRSAAGASWKRPWYGC